MKRLKLFPKIFLYTLGIMLFIIVITHGLIYLLAPRMQLALSTYDDVVVSIRQEQFVTEAVEKALPLSKLLPADFCCLLPLAFQGDCRPNQEDFHNNGAHDEAG